MEVLTLITPLSEVLTQMPWLVARHDGAFENTCIMQLKRETCAEGKLKKEAHETGGFHL